MGRHILRCTYLLVVTLFLGSCATRTISSPPTMKAALLPESWRSYDGKEMPRRPEKDLPRHQVQGIVITIHGLSGSASDFWMLEESWPPRGIVVYGLDLRGQGHDPDCKKRGDIPSAKVWQQDLVTFHRLIREKHPNKPIFWYTESLGTLIAMHAISDLLPNTKEHPAGLIMSAPAAGLRLRPSAFRSAVLTTLIRTFPWKKVNLEKLAGVDDKDIRVTHDTTHNAQMAVTSHYVSHFTLRLLGQIDQMMRRAPKAAEQLRLPILVLASPNDVIASESQIQDLYNHLGSKDKSIHWYRKSYHLLLHDTEREQVLQDATTWVEKRIKGKS